MRDDGLAAPARLRAGPGTARVHTRVRHGMRRQHNWIQLVKFCAVGGSGFLVNLAVFTVASQAIGLHHLVSAALAFAVALTNNFLWNRRWTFRARHGRARFQATRFVAISSASAALAAALLQLLVTALDVPEVPAQAASIAAATPLNFIGNKMWSFGRRSPA
ncbi:MAG TPA: GtrA family protein [Thermoleophilaceae bacterium]|nr:GtrA family protein [Thermoleophilaceae bacterium]